MRLASTHLDLWLRSASSVLLNGSVFWQTRWVSLKNEANAFQWLWNLWIHVILFCFSGHPAHENGLDRDYWVECSNWRPQPLRWLQGIRIKPRRELDLLRWLYWGTWHFLPVRRDHREGKLEWREPVDQGDKRFLNNISQRYLNHWVGRCISSRLHWIYWKNRSTS